MQLGKLKGNCLLLKLYRKLRKMLEDDMQLGKLKENCLLLKLYSNSFPLIYQAACHLHIYIYLKRY